MNSLMRLKTIAGKLLLILLLTTPGLVVAGAVDDPAPTPTSRSALHLQLVYGDLAGVETSGFGFSFDVPQTDNRPSPHDPWLAFDKVQHFSFSLLITVGSQYALVNKLNMREHPALPISMLTSASVGLAKELYDLHYGPHRYFSQRDLVANAAGILVAAGFILL